MARTVASQAWFPASRRGERSLATQARSLRMPAEAGCGCSSAISAQEARARFGIGGHGREPAAGSPAWPWVRRGRVLPSIARHRDYRPWWVAVQSRV